MVTLGFITYNYNIINIKYVLCECFLWFGININWILIFSSIYALYFGKKLKYALWLKSFQMCESRILHTDSLYSDSSLCLTYLFFEQIKRNMRMRRIPGPVYKHFLLFYQQIKKKTFQMYKHMVFSVMNLNVTLSL